MNRSTALPWAGAGLFLLGLGLLPAGALSLGGPAAHTAVYLLLLALAGRIPPGQRLRPRRPRPPAACG